MEKKEEDIGQVSRNKDTRSIESQNKARSKHEENKRGEN